MFLTKPHQNLCIAPYQQPCVSKMMQLFCKLVATMLSSIICKKNGFSLFQNTSNISAVHRNELAINEDSDNDNNNNSEDLQEFN